MVTSGAIEKFALTDEELALACASPSRRGPRTSSGVTALLAPCRTVGRRSRMRRPPADQRRRPARPCAARRRDAVAAAQQLLGQALRHAGRCAGAGRPTRTATSTANTRCSWRCARPSRRSSATPLSDRPLRHRRLLDPDLGGAAPRLRPRLCPHGDGAGARRDLGARRPAHLRRRDRHPRCSSPAPGTSTRW